MTLFFNNDGSILITTPIIINIVTILKFKPHQRFPYLLSGALIATASSAPIAVSNLANLIALKIVGLDLNSYVSMMFVPSMIGITTIALLLFVHFRKDIPKTIPLLGASAFKHENSIEQGDSAAPPIMPKSRPDHPPHLPHSLHPPRPPHQPHPHSHPEHPRHPSMDKTLAPVDIDMPLFKVCITIVVLIRAGLFVGSAIGIPIEWIGMFGALILIGYRWYKKRTGLQDVIRKTPWHIILFAFSIYIVVYGLHNIGLTEFLIQHLRAPLSANYLSASLVSGVLLTVMSNLFNNLPSVMIGTFTLTGMGLDLPTLHIAYLANIIGSDIGSLIIPMGTLASLIWMFLLNKNGIRISWIDCMKVTLKVIPIGLLVSLLSLYAWVEWLFY
jgi:arsenical pump membrane protein